MTDPTIPSPEVKLNDLRAQVLAGKELDASEYRAIIQSLRAKRTGDISAASEKASPRGAAKAQKVEKDTRSLAEILSAARASIAAKKESQQ